MSRSGANYSMTSPILILIRPQMGENIGAVARAMMNFGLRELRIVAPRDGWPNEKAFEMAVHGRAILEQAKIFDTTDEALADLHRVYATTARDRRQAKPIFTLREAMPQMRAETTSGQKVGILLGPERTGLENDEITRSHAILTVPVDPDHASLNLAQCAVLLGYEWWGSQADAPLPFALRGQEPAQHAPLQHFLKRFENMLEQVDYFRNDDKKPLMWQTLQGIFMNSPLSEQEVQSLHGVLTSIEHSLKNR